VDVPDLVHADELTPSAAPSRHGAARGRGTASALYRESWHRASTHPLPDSPRVSHQRPRMSAGDARNPLRIIELESGGQGRNRTIDTRIFSSSESPVRREQVEDPGRDFAGPTELPSPTEPIPKPACGRRPSRAVSSRSARVPAHLDRTNSETRLTPPSSCAPPPRGQRSPAGSSIAAARYQVPPPDRAPRRR
jgi:hypothetical protein